MKVKQYTRVILIAALSSIIFLFISGCGTGLNISSSETHITESQATESTGAVSQESEQNASKEYEKWECIERGCDYIYDPAVGDPTQNIEPGTRFEDLPSTWRCPVCHEGKDKFVKI